MSKFKVGDKVVPDNRVGLQGIDDFYLTISQIKRDDRITLISKSGIETYPWGEEELELAKPVVVKQIIDDILAK